MRVLLRGFQPGIPEGQPVTFAEDLPGDVLCAQCSNVAPVLFTDPRGHGFCGPCRSMCLDKGRFQCPVCEATFENERLFPDDSINQKIGMKQVLCPRSLQDEVIIPFAAFRAHLNGCHCGKDSNGEASSNAAESSTTDESTPSNLVECSVCNEKVPKKQARDHVKACLSKISKTERRPSNQSVPSQTNEDSSVREQSNAEFPRTSTEEVSGVTSKPSLLLTTSGKSIQMAQQARFRCPSCKKDIPEGEVRKHAINCFQWRRKHLQEPEPKPKDVFALLNDYKNEVEEITTKCEKQMEQLTEDYASLETFVGACREETKSEIHQVNDVIMKVHEHHESRISQLQSAVQHILDPQFLRNAVASHCENFAWKEDYYHLYAEMEQVKEDVWKIIERARPQPKFLGPR